LLVTNDLILAELIPALLVRNERRLVSVLQEVERVPLTIDWDGLVDLQVTCLRNGINKVGIPDLIIAQQAMQHHISLFTLRTRPMLLRAAAPQRFGRVSAFRRGAARVGSVATSAVGRTAGGNGRGTA
jgi:hypothetical protein